MLTQLLAKECSNCVHGDGAELHDNNQQTNNFVPQLQHRRLEQLVDMQNLLDKAVDMVEIVNIYPVFDKFDVEIDPDEFYNVTPDYFHQRGEFALVQVRGPGLSCLRPRFKLPPAPV